jgi:hypothetical protein
LCEQESVDPDDSTVYRDKSARLEQGFYTHYTEQENYSTTTEVLLATSYGLTQMLGESLKETGYFDWWFAHQTPVSQAFLGFAMQDIAVVKAINEYMEHPEWQVERGCMWLDKKRKLAHGDLDKALDYYNGDMTGKYRALVKGRRDKLVTIYK